VGYGTVLISPFPGKRGKQIVIQRSIPRRFAACVRSY